MSLIPRTHSSVGKMLEVVIFLKNTPVTSGRGKVDDYSTLLTTRGQLIDKSGNRGLSFGSISDTSSLTLICRFQASLAANLRSDTKIVIDSITYTFSHYKIVDRKKHLYEFQIQCQQP